ncbi:hypothetical protein DUG79_14830 [Vibrio parahaemolyticus]|nr:hypothetical protein [Vibrio parahaemolyticus]
MLVVSLATDHQQTKDKPLIEQKPPSETVAFYLSLNENSFLGFVSCFWPQTEREAYKCAFTARFLQCEQLLTQFMPRKGVFNNIYRLV